MKKSLPVILLAMAATLSLSAQQSTQAQPSLGDVARQQRAQDKAAPKQKVWTNEDFPDSTPPAAAASDNAAPDAKATEDSEKAKDADKDKGEKADKDASKDKQAAPEDQEKLNADWKAKIDAQKAKVADLQREYDLTDRESKIFETSYYADAGNRLRNQKDFHDKETGYRDKMTGLKDQISQEQAKLADLQDQAHKAGASKTD